MSVPIENIRNAKSINELDTLFDVEIEHPYYGWIPYTLNPEDEDQTIDNDALRALIGSDFAAYVVPTQEDLDQAAVNDVRGMRGYILAHEVDPIVSNQLRWNDFTDGQRAAWAQYRTDLLNVPQQEGFPHDVTWPTKPE